MEIVMVFKWIRSWHLLARYVLSIKEHELKCLRDRRCHLNLDFDSSTTEERRERLTKERTRLWAETQRLEGICEGLRQQIAGEHDRPKLRRVA